MGSEEFRALQAMTIQEEEQLAKIPTPEAETYMFGLADQFPLL